MEISLLDMGKTKKRNVRESIISILSREFPLSIKKIYNKIKKEYNLPVTYQAVFKLVKEMLDDKILEKSESEYKLNIGWIKQLEDELKMIKHYYQPLQVDSKEKDVKARVNDFLAELGPKIKVWIGKDECCVVGTSSGGSKLFSSMLAQYLVREGIKTNLCEINEYEQSNQKKLLLSKRELEGKKVLYVDSAIYSGRTYNILMGKLNEYKKRFNMKDLKCAVEKDYLGVADFSIK